MNAGMLPANDTIERPAPIVDDAMTQARWAAVAVTVALSLSDGYDVLAVTFAAPGLSVDWGLPRPAIGLLLSSGLTGMAAGSFLLAPLADLIGRRPIILVSLVLMTLGMALSAIAPGIAFLIGCRFLTGLAVGGCITVINPLAAEFANARWRPLALSCMAMGYPVGAVIGGIAAGMLLPVFGWPALFWAGAIGTLVLIPVTLLLLPESPAFLRNRAMPRECRASLRPRGYAQIFLPGQRLTTLWIATINLLLTVNVYYLLSWLPQMVVDSGQSPAKAALVSAAASLAGIAGGLLLGLAAAKWGLRQLCGAAMILFGVTTIVIGGLHATLPWLMVSAAACGFFLYASAAGLYATLAACFTDQSRASGSGFVIGLGRLGSAAAPAIAGLFFAAGFGPGQVAWVFGSCGIVAGLTRLIRVRPTPAT